MVWWVYKCNSKGHSHQILRGDWRDFFRGNPRDDWGDSKLVPKLAQLQQGDMVIAYQTDRNEIVGVARVRQSCARDTYLYLEPVEEFGPGVKVRPLKESDATIAAIPAFQSRQPATIYQISPSDAHGLLTAVRATSRIGADSTTGEPSRSTTWIEEDEESFLEGRDAYRLHRTRERNSKVITVAKRTRAQADPLLRCEICGFSFIETYGQLGQGFIEAHHTIPISQLSGEIATKAKDIALVCSNCHRMLHKHRPWLHRTKIRQLLEPRDPA
jgi:predicted HNH restriction endonuclease